MTGAGALTFGGLAPGGGAFRGDGLLRLHGTAQAVAVCLPADAVGLGVLDRGGVALDADPKLKAKVERFFVCQSQLAGKLVDADLLRQLAVRSSLGDAPRALQRPWASPNPRTPAAATWNNRREGDEIPFYQLDGPSHVIGAPLGGRRPERHAQLGDGLIGDLTPKRPRERPPGGRPIEAGPGAAAQPRSPAGA